MTDTKLCQVSKLNLLKSKTRLQRYAFNVKSVSMGGSTYEA
jgi:hypothetical protein